MNRFVAFAAIFSVGVLLGALSDVFAARLPLAAAAATLALGAIATRRRWPHLCALALAVCVGLAGLALPRSDLPTTVAPGLYRAELDVIAVEHGLDPDDVTARVFLIGGERIEDGTRIDPQPARVRGDLPPGARAHALVKLRPIASFRNESPHVPWPARRVGAVGRLVGDVSIAMDSPAAEIRARLRSAVRARLDATLPPVSSGVARALVLGDRRAVDEERRAAVRGAGLAHVLAVSGLHVAVTVGLLVFFIAAVHRRIPAIAARLDTIRLACALGAPLALLYGELAGGAPSARRAALTAALAFGVRAAGRRPAPTSVAAIAIAMLVASTPDRILDPGLLLSVLATLAILTAVTKRPIGAGERPAGSAIGSALRSAAIVSTRATLATAPVVWWCFGAVPAVSVLANVLLAPFAALGLLPLALLHALVATAAPPLAGSSAWLFVHAEQAFATACNLLATIPIGQDLPPPSLGQGLVAVGTAAALLLLRRRAHLLAAAATGALLLGGLELSLDAGGHDTGTLRVSFLDVGQGDASLIDLPDGRLMLIDGGGGPGSPGRNALLPLLRSRRYTKIDIAVLSHPHPDHYEGLLDLTPHIPIEEFWDSGQGESEDPGGPVARLIGDLEERGTRVLGPGALCRGPRRFGRASVRTLAPCPRYDPGYDPNDNSLVLRLQYGERSFLFTGDAEAHEEESLGDLGPALRSDVLKVPHHGSRTSSSAGFLALVDPLLSVVSSGRHNRYGHPHEEVFSRLARTGHVAITARGGGVQVVTNGRRLTVRTFAGMAYEL